MRASTRSTTVQISSVSRPVRQSAIRVEQALPYARIELEAVLGLPERRVHLDDVVVQAARLVQPGGGVLDGGATGGLLAHARRRLAYPPCQILDGLAGRATHTSRAKSRLQPSDHRADQGLQHPGPGRVPDPGHAEHEHGADRHLGHELADPAWPTASEARMSRARLHQVRPTRTLKAMATTTPATTEFTRRMPVVRVA